MKRILISEDDVDIAESINIYLNSSGFESEKVQNGKEAIEIIEKEDFDLILMDIMMPVMDGIKATKKIREFSDIPIIMLTAKSEDIDKINGLNIGADDYITKPFNPMELVARINSVLRRTRPVEKGTEDVLSVNGVSINLLTKEVFVLGREVKLTPIELNILKFLMEYPGVVFSIDEIYEHVWNEPAINPETVTVHIRRIREKIEIDTKNPEYLKVVWGLGYKFERGKDDGK